MAVSKTASRIFPCAITRLKSPMLVATIWSLFLANILRDFPSLLVFLFTGLSSLFYNQQAFTVSVVIFCGVGISLLFYLISIRFKKNIAQEVS
jgi:hypothetical protein